MLFAADPAPPVPATDATQPAGDGSPARSLPGRPAVKPAEAQNVVVFCEPGHYGGWPANAGVWSWGNEIVVGFTVGWYKQKSGHAVDPAKPMEKWQARSLDGGLTWSIEKPECLVSGKITPSVLLEPLDFTHPDFALLFQFWNGPCWHRARRGRPPFLTLSLRSPT